MEEPSDGVAEARGEVVEDELGVVRCGAGMAEDLFGEFDRG